MKPRILSQTIFMKAIRLTLVFALLAFCIVLCLWGVGALPLDAASETLKRSLVVVGAIGACLTLVYAIVGSRGKPASENSSTARKPNSGPQF